MSSSKSKRFETQLQSGANHPGSIVFIVFFALAWAVDYFAGAFDQVDNIWHISGFVLVLILWTLQYREIIDLRTSALPALISYHLILGFSIIFILPFGFSYAFLGLILVLLASYAYGRVGALFSTLAVCIFVIASFINLDSPTELNFAELVRTISILFILAINYYYTVEIASSELSELKDTDDKLRSEHQRMNALINSMGDAVLSTDEDGKILSYNGAALQTLDTNETLTNRKLSDFLKLSDSEGRSVDIIEDVRNKNKNTRRRDLIHTYKDGEKINLYTNASPVKIGYGEGSQRGFTLILRDITKEKSLEEERDEFISVVSHELRTPITVTEGKVSNAMLYNDREAKNKQVASMLKEAHDQVVFLADMINDLATLARAERNTLDFTLEQIDPIEMVQTLASTYEIEAKQNKLELKTQTPKKIPPLTTSPLYLKEVLQNFITNSLKYTQKGSVTIGVSHSEKNTKFFVKDTGIGISKSDQKKLFDKFFRSEDYRTRESSGTGLGLYVTAKLAEKIKAKIEVKSTLNKGSVFTITVHNLTQKKTKRGQDTIG